MNIRTKVVLWYGLLVLVIMVAALGFIFYMSTSYSEKSSRENLIAVVENSLKHIEREGSNEKENKPPERNPQKEQKGRGQGQGQGQGNASSTATPKATLEVIVTPEAISTPEALLTPEALSTPEASKKGNSLNPKYNFLNHIEEFEDGVFLLLYDEKETLLQGAFPITLNADDFTFKTENSLYTIAEKNDGTAWIVYERTTQTPSGAIYKIRGITQKVDASESLRSVAGIALWAIPLFLCLAVAGGFIITKRAFDPIKKISDTAEKIAKDNDLSRRIDLGEGRDEIHALANTFDSMFERLEEAFENEKQFTSDASHELRTPISVIMSQCEYSIENAQTLDEAKSGLKNVLEKTQKMSSLVNQLLMLARADKGHQKINPEELDVSELMAIIAEEKQSMAKKKGITISVNSEENVVINADETLIMRMLINLVDNAIIYGKNGGKVEMGISRGENDTVVGYVSDDGIGISESDLPHIFERFYRADKSRTSLDACGMGLGLCMVKWIVNAHGGEITVESKKGEGTKFTFTLPTRQVK